MPPAYIMELTALLKIEVTLQDEGCGHGVDGVLTLLAVVVMLGEDVVGLHSGSALIPQCHLQACGFFHQNIVRVGSRPVWEVCLSEPRFPNMKSGSSKSLQGLETAGKRLR